MENLRQSLSLDGRWQIALDEDNRGCRDEWADCGFPPSLGWRHLNVPSVWQEIYPDYEGVVWYRRRFVAPAAWQGRRIALNVGAADFVSTFWLNGKLLVSHRGGYSPFSLEASHALRCGQENELVARVADCGIEKEVDGYRLSQIPCAKSVWYRNFSGIYQSVTLEATSPAFLRDVFALWQKDHLALRFEMHNSAHASLALSWQATLLDGATPVAEANDVALDCAPGPHTVETCLVVPNAHLWSPGDPHLYRLRVELAGGAGDRDAIETRVGLRTITIRNGRFVLNGQPWLPKIILYQPHYPATLAYPPSAAFVRCEMEQIKQAGFNMVRFHLKPPPPLYLDIADEIGLTVYAETALGWIRRGPAIEDHFRREIAEMMRRDRNHASVLVWGLINENGREAALARRMLPYARRFDPSRPIIDNCGWFSMWDGGGWLSSSYVTAGRRARHWRDLHLYPRTPVTQAEYDWLNTLGGEGGARDPGAIGYGDAQANRQWVAVMGRRASPVFVSEYGVGALPDLDAVVEQYAPGQRRLPDAQDQQSLRDSLARLMEEHHLTDVYRSIADLAEAEGQNMAEGVRWQTEALRGNPQVTGYGLIQYNDASWEIGAGLVDQWRDPKPALAAAAAANAPTMLALSGHLRNARAGARVTLACSLVNETRLRGAAALSWRISGPNGRDEEVPVQRLRLHRARVEFLHELTFSTASEGRYSIVATLGNVNGVVCQASAALHVWDEPPHGTLGDCLFVSDGISARRPADAIGGVWLVARPDGIAPADVQSVLEHVAAGDSALFLEMFEQDAQRLNDMQLLPFRLELRCSPSSWLGYLHYAHAHPVFSRLPAPGLVGRQEYNAVLARRSLVGLPGESVVVALSSTGLERARLQRVQPSFWAGSDLQVVAYGKGTLIFSQFLLRETVGSDPVADRLLRNLVRLGLSAREGGLRGLGELRA